MGAIEDAIQAAELIEDRTSKANSERRKLQEATRELRETIAAAQDARRALEAVEARVAAITEESVREHIEVAVKEQIDKLGALTEDQMRKTSAKIISEFDKLKNALLGLDDGKKSIPQMVDEMEAALQLKWPVFMNAVLAAQATLRGCSDEHCNKPARWAVLAMLDVPGDDGSIIRGEGHFHFCTTHKEAMKHDPTITILKSFELETRMCPYQHSVGRMHEYLEL